MVSAPPLWLQCSDCSLILRCPAKKIVLVEHHRVSGKSLCEGSAFVMLPDVDEQTLARADSERARRAKKYELLHPKRRRKPSEKQETGSRWDGVRATTARPSRGTTGLPTLGKR